MSKFKIEYKGDLSTEITHLESGNTIVTDAPKDNQGLGRTFSPTDMTASSLGSCMITIIAIACRTQSIKIENMSAKVIKNMSKDLPRRIASIDVVLKIKGKFDDKTKLIIRRAAKSCPVHHTLSDRTAINLDINYIV